jgi:hypothetical protein
LGIERFEAITTVLPASALRWQVLLWKIRKVGAGHTSSIEGHLAWVERCFPAAAWAPKVGFENSPIAIYHHGLVEPNQSPAFRTGMGFSATSIWPIHLLLPAAVAVGNRILN